MWEGVGEVHMMPDEPPQVPPPGRPQCGAHTNPAPTEPSHPPPGGIEDSSLEKIENSCGKTHTLTFKVPVT